MPTYLRNFYLKEMMATEEKEKAAREKIQVKQKAKPAPKSIKTRKSKEK